MSNDTGPTKLPGLPVLRTSDRELAAWAQKVADHLEIRSGSRGNPLERAVTLRELEGLNARLAPLTRRRTLGAGDVPVDFGDGLTGSISAAQFAQSIRELPLFKDLSRRLDDPSRFDDLNSEVRKLLLESITEEAAKRGVDVSTLESKIQTASDSLAYRVEEVTAALEGALAGVREVTFANANETGAQAGRVTQVEARIDGAPLDPALIMPTVYATLAALTAAVTMPDQGRFYQVSNPVVTVPPKPNLLYRFDGTAWVKAGLGLVAKLEEVMKVTADRTKGLEAQYTLKVDTGGAFAAIGLAAKTNLAGASDSAIILRANKLAFVGDTEVVGTGAGEINPTSPDLTRVPFGVDAATNTVYLNGNVRIGGGTGKTLTEITTASGVTLNYTSQFFKYDTTGSVVNPTITLTAAVTGTITGTLAWQIVSGYSGSVPANVTVTAPGNVSTATINAANLTADTATFRITLTSGVDVYEDTVTLTKLRDGSDAYTARLTNDSAGVATSSAGVPVTGGFGAASGTMEVYRGSTKLTTGVAYSLTANTQGVTASINSTSGAYSATAAGTWPAATRTALLTFTATVTGGPTLTKDFVLTKNPQGSSGLYKDYVFIRSATVPSTPTTASDPTAQGWSDTPPTGANPLYVSTADRDVLTNVVSGAWTAPVRLDGAQGNPGVDGAYNQTRYAKNSSTTVAPTASETTVTSTTAANTWSFAPPTLGTGEFLWMQIRTVTPPAAAPLWSTTTPTRVSGEKGEPGAAGQNVFNVLAYRRSATALTGTQSPGDTGDGNGGASSYTFSTRVLNLPAGTSWSSTIPAGTDPLYASAATASSATDTDSIAAAEWSDPVKLADNGVNGLNTASVYMYMRTSSNTAPNISSSGADVTYTFSTKSTGGTFPASTSGTWTALVPATGGNYLWVSIATAASTTDTDAIGFGEWSAARLLAFSGTDGLNTATVYAYQRSATALTSNPGAVTFTFASNSITTPATLLNGWSKTIPAGANPLYVTVASAANTAATDDIAAAEWSAPVVLSQDGVAGLNSATVEIFARNSTPATAPTLATAGSATYTFATAALTGQPSGWTTTIPTAASGSVVWVSRATAAANTATDTIANTEWSAPVILSQDGLTAKMVSLTADSYVFRADSANALTSTDVVKFTLDKQNTVAGVTWSTSPAVTLYNAATAGAATTTGDTVYLRAADFAANTKVTVTATCDGLSDFASVIRVRDGDLAPVVVMANPGHPLPATSAGVVSSYTGSGTTAQVLVGGTARTITAISATGTGITAGTASFAGTTATVGDHSAITADSATVKLTITYTKPDGTSGTAVDSQTVYKAKGGVTGTRGTRKLYDTNAAYIATYATYPATATSLIATATAGSTPTTPIKGDEVTFTNGTSYTTTLTYDGTNWVSPGVVIDGNLLVTGSITATKLNVAAIESSTGNIKNLAVDTLQIAGNAVTVPLNVTVLTGASDISGAGNTTFIDALSLDIAAPVSVPINVVGFFSGRAGYPAGPKTTAYKVVKVVAGVTSTVTDYGAMDAITDLPNFQFYSSVAAGTTATFKVQFAGLDSTAKLQFRSLTILGVKK